MANCRTIDKNTVCTPGPATATPRVCAPFEACLPLGAGLLYDGVCLTYTPPIKVADGIYGRVVVQGGCIIGVEVDPPLVYTPPPCYPEPAPCAGGDAWPGVSLHTGNILTVRPDGLYGTVTAQSTSTVTLTGDGSAENPLRASVMFPDNQTVLLSGTPDVLILQGAGTVGNPYNISHRTGVSGTYNGFSFDAYGHLIKYEAPTAGAIDTLVAGPGVVIQQAGTQATVALETVVSNGGTWTCGGVDLTVDIYGRVIDVQRGVAIEAGTFRSDRGLVTLNAYGSVTAVAPYAPPMDFQFSYQVSGAVEVLLTITTGMSGRFRVNWTGAVAEPTLHIDGNTIAPGVVTPYGCQALTSMTFQGGEHVLRLTPPDGQDLTGIVDIWVVA